MKSYYAWDTHTVQCSWHAHSHLKQSDIQEDALTLWISFSSSASADTLLQGTGMAFNLLTLNSVNDNQQQNRTISYSVPTAKAHLQYEGLQGSWRVFNPVPSHIIVVSSFSAGCFSKWDMFVFRPFCQKAVRMGTDKNILIQMPCRAGCKNILSTKRIKWENVCTEFAEKICPSLPAWHCYYNWMGDAQ